LVEYWSKLEMVVLAEEEKLREGKKLLEMLQRMGQVSQRWNEAGGLGEVRIMSWTEHRIVEIEMN
jgi:hypothetical protein